MRFSIDFLKNCPEFAPAVADWLFSQWGHLHPGASIDSVRESVLSRLNDSRIPLSLVAISDGNPVGTASIYLHDMESRPELSPWLAAVFVRTDMRKQGIGGALVQAIEQQAIEQGIATLYLFTPDKRGFYQRMNWQFREETEYRGEQVTIMAKDFSIKETS